MSTNFLSVISQTKARIDTLSQQKTTVDQQIGQVTSDLGVANTELTGRQTELGNAETALSNFQVPEAADAPMREDFTTVDEDGNEVFDQAAFDAESAKYEASVRAHDEAVAQKQQLEADVTTKKGEVGAAQANCDGLEQTRQAKEGEQATIVDDLNEAMEELNIAEAQQAEAEAAAAQAAQEAAAAQEANAPTNSEAEQPEEEQHFKEVPVQNNKGWDHYAKMELEAELGRKPTQQEIRERSSVIKERNIKAGKVNEDGALFVGRGNTVLLRDEIDETKLQTEGEAVHAYHVGQARLAAEAEAKAKAEAEAKAMEEAQAQALNYIALSNQMISPVLSQGMQPGQGETSVIGKVGTGASAFGTALDIPMNTSLGKPMVMYTALGENIGSLPKGATNFVMHGGKAFGAIGTGVALADAAYGYYTGEYTGFEAGKKAVCAGADAVLAGCGPVGLAISAIGTENIVDEAIEQQEYKDKRIQTVISAFNGGSKREAAIALVQELYSNVGSPTLTGAVQRRLSQLVDIFSSDASQSFDRVYERYEKLMNDPEALRAALGI